jgi:hypothetical protein
MKYLMIAILMVVMSASVIKADTQDDAIMSEMKNSIITHRVTIVCQALVISGLQGHIEINSFEDWWDYFRGTSTSLWGEEGVFAFKGMKVTTITDDIWMLMMEASYKNTLIGINRTLNRF